MAIAKTKVSKVAVDNNVGDAYLTYADATTLAPGSASGRFYWTADDNGTVIGLSMQDGKVMAGPVAVGVAHCTAQAFESGAVVTATATCTVTKVGTKLVAAWTSGTLTIN